LGHLLSGHATTTIFDCGASVGTFTTAILREFPNATVHAIEPHPSSVKQLHKSFNENTRVIIERAEVGDFNGVSSFQINHLPQTSSLKTRPIPARR
jgi:FkbM family methyltransferase